MKNLIIYNGSYREKREFQFTKKGGLYSNELNKKSKFIQVLFACGSSHDSTVQLRQHVHVERLCTNQEIITTDGRPDALRKRNIESEGE